MKSRIGISVAVVLVAAVAAWVGGGMYAQKTYQTQVKATTDKMSANPVLAVKDVKQDSGFLTSSGEFTIVIHDPSTTTSFTLAAQYKASHYLLPGSITQVTWLIKPAGDNAKEIANMFGDNARMDGVATMGYDRQMSSTISIPTLAAKEDGSSFQFGPVRGSISGGAKALRADIQVERMMFKQEDESADLKNLKYQINITDLDAGLYNGQMTVDEISTKDAAVSGIAIKVASTAHDDRIDLTMSPSVKSFAYEGLTVTDASFDFVYKDLDAKSIQTISRILNNSDLTNLTANEKQEVQTAVRNLFYQGFSVGIYKLTATYKQVIVDGSVSVELKKSATTTPADFNLVKLVRSSGQVVVKNLDPQYKGIALLSGMASETPDGIKAGYELTDGKVAFNGQTVDVAEEFAAAQEVMIRILTENLFD